MNVSRFLAASGAALALAASASAITFSTNFDNGSAGDLASSFAHADFSFHNGFVGDLLDADGEIVGPAQWQIDTENDALYPVFVDNPDTSLGYGAAPSGLLALQVVDQSVLIYFSYLVDIQSFSVTLDNSTYGNLFNTTIDFVNGATVAFQQGIDQTVPGLVVNVGAVSGVRAIALPIGAFYDNLSIEFTAAAVPEPSTFAALAGVAGFGLAALRRRRQA